MNKRIKTHINVWRNGNEEIWDKYQKAEICEFLGISTLTNWIDIAQELDQMIPEEFRTPSQVPAPPNQLHFAWFKWSLLTLVCFSVYFIYRRKHKRS